jgi:hypothetical protein
MRKPQASGHGPADRIVLRAARAPNMRTSHMTSRRTGTDPQPRKLASGGGDGATMDYQMGFTSGPSN